MKKTNCSNIGIVFSAVILGPLTGCVGYVDSPHHDHARGYPVHEAFAGMVTLDANLITIPVP